MRLKFEAVKPIALNLWCENELKFEAEKPITSNQLNGNGISVIPVVSRFATSQAHRLSSEFTTQSPRATR